MDVIESLAAAEWRDALHSMPRHLKDAYFLPEYHRLHEANGEGTAQCSMIVQPGTDRCLLIPGLRRRIVQGCQNEELWDLQSSNGYGGPLASPDSDRQFIESAWSTWRCALARTGAVAAFFRLHPLIENVRWLPSDAQIADDRKTVFVNLSAGLDRAWQEADSAHRNMVNKGRGEGLDIRWDCAEDWNDFELLYAEAMERLQAPADLRFSASYFTGLRQMSGAHLAAIRKDQRLEAAAVILFGEMWAHYHLSARRPDAANHLTNCLLQSALQEAAGKQLQGLHLGGGRTRLPDDRLLKFKQSLGGRLLDFKVALVIVDSAGYESLCERWTQENGATPQWLLGYRQPALTGVAEVKR